MLQTHLQRQIVPLCTVSFESFTITFHNNGTLFAVVFTDNDECRLAFDSIQRQTDKHYNKHLRRAEMKSEEVRAKTVHIEDDPAPPSTSATCLSASTATSITRSHTSTFQLLSRSSTSSRRSP